MCMCVCVCACVCACVRDCVCVLHCTVNIMIIIRIYMTKSFTAIYGLICIKLYFGPFFIALFIFYHKKRSKKQKLDHIAYRICYIVLVR